MITSSIFVCSLTCTQFAPEDVFEGTAGSQLEIGWFITAS
jgi:hypothetical protein